MVCRGGPWPSRGCSRRGGVRRDEGIPPYGRFIGSAYTGKAACFRRGVRGRGMPLPYMPSGNDRPHGKAGYPPGGKPIVGADSISARGVRGAAGLPGRDESRPYEQILRFVSPGWPRRFPRFVGEGHGPPAGVCGGAGCGGMRASRPTVVPYVPHQPGAPRVSDARNLYRGGFHCARRRVSEAKDRRSGS